MPPSLINTKGEKKVGTLDEVHARQLINNVDKTHKGIVCVYIIRIIYQYIYKMVMLRADFIGQPHLLNIEKGIITVICIYDKNIALIIQSDHKTL